MSVYDDIKTERNNQDNQWGGPEHDDKHAAEDWVVFIHKQAAKADRIIGDLDSGDAVYRNRMVKIAALAVAAIESLDRNTEAAEAAREGVEP